MNEMKIENWNGHNIRFVWKDGDWWGVAKDVADALDYDSATNMVRMVDKSEKSLLKIFTAGTECDLHKVNPTSKARKAQEMTILTELGIYDCVFGSHKKEAKEFKLWVFTMLKELRKASGLEGFEIFRMFDKEHQKEAMRRLQDGLRQPRKVDYIKANAIADKAVSNRYGHPKMVKKSDMSPEMLAEREAILDDTVQLMALNDKYGMGISVSQTIYQVKGTNHYENH